MYRLRQLLLIAVDGLIFYLALFLALIIRYQQISTTQWNLLIIPMSWLFGLAFIICFISGLYDLTRIGNNWNFYKKVLAAAIAWIAVGVIYFYIQAQLTVSPKTILLLTAIIAYGMIAIWRLFAMNIISGKILTANIVFVGIAPETLELAETIKNNPQLGYKTIGLVTAKNEEKNDLTAGLTVADSLEKLTQLTDKQVQIIVLAPQIAKNYDILNELYPQLFKQVEMIGLDKFYEEITGRIPPFTFSESWFLTNLKEQSKKLYDRERIIADYLFSCILAFFFIVTFIPIAFAIKLTSKGPLFFIQTRIGRNGQSFKMYKYRTMVQLNSNGSAEMEGPQFTAKKDRRVTMVGGFLRATRLDEIPQFINILKNEMGLIGPRPERPEFVAELTRQIPFYPLRHLIKPGITGWAQLKKSYYATLEENQLKLQYDLFYIKNRGFFLDTSIVLRTIRVVLGFMGR